MIVMVGLDHRRAGVETRGRLSFAGDALHSALRAISASDETNEAVILSTCNRTEIYLGASDPDAATLAALHFIRAHASRPLVSTSGLVPTVADDGALESALYTALGMDAVTHLYHVSAGLRSMVIGEAQILGQVRDALFAAEDLHTVGEELRAAFTGALQAGKRVRTITALSQADASVATLAIHVARARLGSLADRRVTLVGAGKTIELCAQLLRQDGAGSLTVANRNLDSALALAHAVAGTAISLDAVSEAIARSDMVISATAAPYTVITTSDVAPRPSAAPLLVVDLAVPADVDTAVADTLGVSLITLDTLRDTPATMLDDPSLVDALRGRQSDIEEAERIIESALRDYVRAQTVRHAAPGITALRRHVDQSQQAELESALAQLPNLSKQERAIIERFGARLVDKMFHHLVRRIRTLAEYDEIPPETSMQVLSRLFAETPDPNPRKDQNSD